MPALALLLAPLMLADDPYFPEPAGDAAMREAVEFRTHTHAGQTYNHLFVAPPTVKPGHTYPLVVFLHGAGERGDDPNLLLKHFFPQMLSAEFRKRFPCYILAPQCPAGEKWVNTDWSADGPRPMPAAMGAPLAAARSLLDETLAAHPIEPCCVYLTGISMGGYGTWDWVAREPRRFTAAVPICGGGDPAAAAELRGVPLWVAHGDRDPAVPVERSRAMVAAVRAAGGRPIYVEYPGMEHDVWTAAYANPDGAIPWLFGIAKAMEE